MSRYRNRTKSCRRGGVALVVGAAVVGCVGATGGGVGYAATRQTGPEVHIKLSTTALPTDPEGVGATDFQKLVEARSHGRITVTIYPDNALGGEAQVLALVKSGSVQMGFTGAGTLGEYVPDISILEAPYMWRNFPTENYILHSAGLLSLFGKQMLAKGLELGGINFYFGRRELTANVPATKPSALHGLTIRTPPSAVNLLGGRVLGGNPTGMDFSEVYLALKSGTIAAEENPVTIIYENHLNEVQKYLIMTNHIQQTQVLSLNPKWWNGLSGADKALINTAEAEAAHVDTTLAIKDETVDATKLEALGMKVVHPDLGLYVRRARQLDPAYAKSIGALALYHEILSAQGGNPVPTASAGGAVLLGPQK